MKQKRKRITVGFCSQAKPTESRTISTEKLEAERNHSRKMGEWLTQQRYERLKQLHEQFVEPITIVHEVVVVHDLKDLDKVYPYAKGASGRVKEVAVKNPFKEKVVSETVTIKVMGKEIAISREEYEQHYTLNKK